MSRSYKKNPYVTDHKRKTTKQSKRIANRIVRRKLGQDEDMPARSQHKKMTESWNICDYKWRMTEAEAVKWYTHHMADEASDYFKKRYPTLESWLKYWKKCYKNK